MYKIIGADGKQYGPVTQEQMRQWIFQGRANAQTQVQLEGSPDWQPLGSYPEFAEALGGAVAPVLPASAAGPAVTGSREAALIAVRGPAMGLKIIAVLMLVFVVLDLIATALGWGGARTSELGFGDQTVARVAAALGGVLGIVVDFVVAALAVVILKGASRMESLQGHSFAIVAAVLAMLPCSLCCLFGLPVGIWALVVLNRPDVKSQFS
jgi:hypothetical protein